MEMFKRSSSAVVLLAALLSSTANGQNSNINFQPCGKTVDTRARQNNGQFDENLTGSQRRTYGNLCSGSMPFGTTTTTETPISARNSDPFRRFCDLIDRYPNVQALMATGNSPHTVFAPTDAAFAKVDGLISRVDEQRLLELHILGQARLKRDLRCGQTYRSINTRQDQRNTQRSKTECVSAGRAQQLGPGNTVNGLRPNMGSPNGVFNRDEFQHQNSFNIVVDSTDIPDNINTDLFSSDVVSCNGVIHVVDEVLLPGGPALFQTGYYGANFQGAGHSHTGAYGAPHSHGGSVNSYHSHSGSYGYGLTSSSLYYNPYDGFRRKK